MKAKKKPSAISCLPFVGLRKRPRKDQFQRDFWHNVTSTGDVLKDHKLGGHYANLAMQAMMADRFPPLLGLDRARHDRCWLSAGRCGRFLARGG
jgi:hypothetical protein